MECSWNPNTSVQMCLDPLLQRTLFLSLLTPVFWGCLKPQVRINKMANSIDYHPYTSRSASKVHHFIFLKTPSGFISLQDACWIFSETFIYSTMCGENFQIYGVHIPRKCIDSRHFYHRTLGKRKLFIPQGSIFSRICFPQHQKEVEENMIYQTSIRKYEDDLGH